MRAIKNPIMGWDVRESHRFYAHNTFLAYSVLYSTKRMLSLKHKVVDTWQSLLVVRASEGKTTSVKLRWLSVG